MEQPNRRTRWPGRRRLSLIGAALVVTDEALSAWCPECEAERLVVSVVDRRCVQCGTLAPEVVKGQEVEVTALELDE